MQGYISPFMYTYREYMYIWSLSNIYIGHIYMLARFFFVFMHFLCGIYANVCKGVQIHAPLHITASTWRAAVPDQLP